MKNLAHCFAWSFEAVRHTTQFAQLLPLIVCLTVNDLSSLQASTFELSGILKTEAFKPSGDVVWSTSELFTLVTDGTHYKARIAKPEKDMTKDYLEVAFDGTNTYYLNAMLGWAEVQRASGVNIADNVATAVLTAVPVPQFPFAEQASVLWCAFVAPSYLKTFSQGDPILTPFCTGMKQGSDAYPSDFLKWPAKWSYHRSGEGYLAQLSYFTLGRQTVGSPPRETSEPVTNSIYRTMGSTVLGDLEIPSSGVATTFVKDVKQDTTRKVFEFSFAIQGKSLIQDSFVYQPTIPGITSFTEERFNDGKKKDFHFTYVGTNWLNLADAKRTAGYTGIATAFAARPLNNDNSRLQWSLFVGLFIVPIFVLIWRRKQKLQSN